MIDFNRDIQILAVVTAVACALPGAFLVLRRMSMMTDAVSHVLLLGIVIAFLVIRDLHSPLLLAGAALSGIATVAIVEFLQRTKLVKEDAAIGLVFPALFSIGVILVSVNVRNIHLDTDAVLLGEIILAPLNRYDAAGFDLGPKATVRMVAVLILNVAFIALFYKELKLATFDPRLAESLGFRPQLMHYILMTLVSITAVAAFDAVGSVLVVALFIVPAATAYLLTDRLSIMLVLSAILAGGGSLLGFRATLRFENANVPGALATMFGIMFAAVLVFAPKRGLLSAALRHYRQRREFLQTMLTIHLLNHEGTPEQADECRLAGLHEHLRWQPQQVERVVSWAKRDGLVELRGEQLALTPAGRDRARELFEKTEAAN